MKHRAVVLSCAALAALSIPVLRAATGAPGPLRPGWAQARPFAAQDTVPALRRDTTPRPRPARDTSRTARADSARERAPAPADTLVDRLLQLDGYVPVEYAGDSAQFTGADRTLRLRGDPQVTREGRTLTARDSLVYQEGSNSVAAYGRPRVSGGQEEPIVGETMFYDLERRRASVQGAQTKITENATWLVRGDVTSEEQGKRIYARGSEFTSDDRPEPAYHFKADRIMVVRNRILVGRPAYLYFKNVPVMALPFIVQDLERGRRSGFLIPQFEINDIFRTHSAGANDRGTGREISNIGYYFAINPYMGASIAGGWRSGTYTSVAANLDYRWRRRFLDGSFGFVAYNRIDESFTYTLNGRTSWQPTERTSLNASLDFAKSTQFERNRTVDPFRQTQDLNSSFAITRRLDWGNFSSTVSRRQSLANDDVTLTPSLGLTIEPITFFPAASADDRSWYNDATLTLGFNGSGSSFDPGDPFQRRPGQDQYSFNTSPTLQFGDLGLSTSLQYQFERTDSLPALDTAGVGIDLPIPGGLRPLGGRTRETLNLSASTGYQIALIGSTRLTPSITFQQRYVRADTLVTPGDTIGGVGVEDSVAAAYGTLVGEPARINFGAGLSTDLYGFFPGFAGYSAVRHHLRPSVSYTFSPAAGTGQASRVQRILFGEQVGQTVNRISIGLDQTFEAKVRNPRPVRGDSMADSARSMGNAATPQEARKITLLALNTSAVGYSFGPRDTLSYRFETEQVTNSVRSDLLGGLTFTTAHDLFADARRDGRVQRGVFSPYLTAVSTSFSLGANSALFRRLGFGGRPEQERTPAEQRGRMADTAGTQPVTPPGGATFTGNNQRTGGGAWNLNLNYNLARTRRTTGDVTPGRFERGDQSLQGGLTFHPTRNWAVNWTTQYSITSGEFAAHSLHFKRDLYRWEANFDFSRAPNGNTSFGFRVHLIDLPDLKADYNERNLGIDRPDENRRPAVNRTER
ncbi:MAG TPA: putative LPS assembly protein LptD [Longimicrobium sp.]